MKFDRKLDRKDAPYVIVDEAVAMSNGRGEGFLKHDNIIEKTVEVFTEPQKQGLKVMNFTVEMKPGFEWRRYIVVFAQADTVYVTYECYGDTVEAADVNELQAAAELTDENLHMIDTDLQAYKARRDNPHNVTKAQVGLGSADNTSDVDKPVSTAQREVMDKIVSDSNAADAVLRQQISSHEARKDNPHEATKAQVGLGSVDDTADMDKPVSTAQREAMNEIVASMNEADAALQQQISDHEARNDNPHVVTKTQVGLGNADNTSDADKPVSTAQQTAMNSIISDMNTADTALGTRIDAHVADRTNPHVVTKTQVGLGNVDNVKQASKTDFDAHTVDAVKHLTASERQSWNDKYTKSEVDNKFSALETATDWKESVATYADIAKVYPNPDDGWTVNAKDTNYTYRYDGTKWVAISANAIPKATQSVDGLLTASDKTAYDDANAKKHTHGNKSVLDGITSALVDTWNAAYTHASDAVKHITAAERTLWNTVSGKVDKVSGKGLSANDYTTAEKTKLAGIAEKANNYVHPGSGTNPHGTTKTDVGLGNVPNVVTNDQTPTFTQASARANIVSGEKLSVIFGKAMKFFADLKTVAFSGSYNDLSDKPSIPSAYTHPTSSGNKHIPAGGSSGQFLKWSADGTAVWGADNNTTYSAATQAANGLMSATDKKKLDGVAEGANKYVHPGSGTNPHGTTKTDVSLGNVPNVATNDQTPTFTQAGTRANIVSGDKLSVIFGKVMKFFADLKTVAFSGSYNDLTDKPAIPGIPSSLPANGGTSTYTNFVNGTYTGNGGNQLPSYIPSGKIRWNMMRTTGNYADWMMMDSYSGGDVPWVTAFGIEKAATPAAWVMTGAKGGEAWGTQQRVALFTATPTSGQVLVADGTTGGVKSSGFTIASSVPSGAKFTDTVYAHPTTAGNKHIPAAGTVGQVLKNSAAGTAVWGAANDHTHTKSNITDFPSSLPANGGTSTYANYVNANNIAASTNMNSLTTPGFFYCPANATAATLTNCPTGNAFFLIVGKHAGTFQMLVEYMASGFRIRVRNMYNSTWGAWIAIYTANEKPTPADIGAAPVSHTHNYLPTGGVTWNQLRGQ